MRAMPVMGSCHPNCLVENMAHDALSVRAKRARQSSLHTRPTT